jgi:transcription termination factor NusB
MPPSSSWTAPCLHAPSVGYLTPAGRCERTVIRLSPNELFEAHDRSQALVINEAVVLAQRFGTDDSSRFVNGVLSALAAEARPTA